MPDGEVRFRSRNFDGLPRCVEEHTPDKNAKEAHKSDEPWRKPGAHYRGNPNFPRILGAIANRGCGRESAIIKEGKERI